MEDSLEFWYQRGFNNPEEANPFREEWEDLFGAFFLGQVESFEALMMHLIEKDIGAFQFENLMDWTAN
jgi:DNA mismatch repair protein MutH